MCEVLLRRAGGGSWRGGLDLHHAASDISMIDDGVLAEFGMPRMRESFPGQLRKDWMPVNGGCFSLGDIGRFKPREALAHFGFTSETLKSIVLLNWERVEGWPHAEPWLVATMEAIRELRSDTFIYIYDLCDLGRWREMVDGYMVSCNGFSDRGNKAWRREMVARLGVVAGARQVVPMFHPKEYGDIRTRESMLRFRAMLPEITVAAVWGVDQTPDALSGLQTYWHELEV